MEIEDEKTTEVWKKALKFIISHGRKFAEPGGAKGTQVFNLSLKINNPKADVKKPIEIMRRFEWIYPSLDELENIIFKKTASFGHSYVYGPRIFNFNSIKDQVDGYVIPLLKKDPSSRRAVISIWNPITDSEITNKDCPGLLMIDFKYKHEKLRATAIIRSTDMFIGWPANIYQIFVLQNYIAEETNLKPGPILTYSTNAHIFEQYNEKIEKILSRKRN